MGDKTKATRKTTEEENAQPPSRQATGRPCRENRTLLSWYEEAMKEAPRSIEDAITPMKEQEKANYNSINVAPNPSFINGTLTSKATTVLNNLQEETVPCQGDNSDVLNTKKR